jgi:hypothetical protein
VTAPPRGGLPLAAVEAGDARTVIVDHPAMASFILVLARQPSDVDAAELVHADLAAGAHMITPRVVDTDDPALQAAGHARRRPAIGIDTFDLLLDLSVTPEDLSRSRWKDEDGRAQARRPGSIDHALHRRVDDDRDRVISLVEACRVRLPRTGQRGGAMEHPASDTTYNLVATWVDGSRVAAEPVPVKAKLDVDYQGVSAKFESYGTHVSVYLYFRVANAT